MPQVGLWPAKLLRLSSKGAICSPSLWVAVASLPQGGWTERAPCHQRPRPALLGAVLLLLLDPLNGRNSPVQQNFRGLWVLTGLDRRTVCVVGSSTGDGCEWGRPSLCCGCELGGSDWGVRKGEPWVCRTRGRASTRRGPLAPVNRCVSACPAPGLLACSFSRPAGGVVPSVSVVKLQCSLSNPVIPLQPFLLPRFLFLSSALFAQVRKGEGMGEVNH